MIRRTLIAFVALSFAAFFAPTIALAEENHVAEAITHTRQAVDAGLDGKADGLVEHAKQALEHAQAAQKEKSNRFVRGGIVHLKQAIKFGEKGNAKGGVKHAKEALAKLDHAPH
jgi:hypothetical protein